MYPRVRTATAFRFAATGAMLITQLLPVAVKSQTLTPSFGVGIAVPSGSFGAARSAGPLLNASILLGESTRVVRIRFGVETAWMRGSASGESEGSWRESDLRVVNGLASVLIAPFVARSGPYAMFGAGIQRAWATGVRNPYGAGGSLHAGVGVDVPIGRSSLSIELVPQLLLTDFGSEEWSPGIYWPISVAWRFRSGER